MAKAFRFLAAYAAAFLVLVLVMDGGSGPSAREDLLPLPAELAVAGAGPLCGSAQLRDALGVRFRWLAGDRGPVWRRGLAAACHEGASGAVLSFSSGGKLVAKVAEEPGRSAPESRAAHLALRAWADDAVTEAALKAYLDNQADLARAGADLWRLGRWSEAAETLSAALENGWSEASQAEIYFGLADAYAHLGKPRQAYWYALSYLAAAGDRPAESSGRRLRGLGTLIAEQSSTVEPGAKEISLRFEQAQARRETAAAVDALRDLCRAAPWAAGYQDALAAYYRAQRWESLAESWERRAALTRRLSGDADLQARLMALTR